MQTLFVFIDESGDLGPGGSRYFVVAAIVTENPAQLRAVIKKARHYRMKKRLKKLNEFKANYADPPLRRRILQGIANCNCRVHGLIIEKSQMRPELYDAKEKFFNFICGVLLRTIARESSEVRIVIDRRTGNARIIDDINRYVALRIRQINPSVKIQILHARSEDEDALQAVDFVAWAYHRKYEDGDESYYEIIQGLMQNIEREKMWKK